MRKVLFLLYLAGLMVLIELLAPPEWPRGLAGMFAVPSFLRAASVAGPRLFSALTPPLLAVLAAVIFHAGYPLLASAAATASIAEAYRLLKEEAPTSSKTQAQPKYS